MVSNYKSLILRKARRKKRKVTGEAKAPAAARAGGITMEDIQAVKELANRLGADKLRQLAEVLAK